MFQRKLDRHRRSEVGGGKKNPGELDEQLDEQLDDDLSDLPPLPDDDDLDLSWGKAVMPDFDEDDSVRLSTATVDHRSIYAAAAAVDSTDATVISSDKELAAKDGRGKLWIPLAIIGAALLAAAVAWFVIGGGTNVFAGDPAARVNGETITVQELDARLASIAAQNPAMFDPELGGIEEAAARQLVLDSMIDDMLMMQEAEREGVNISNADVEAEMNEVIASFPSEEAFDEQLTSGHFTRDMLKQHIRYSMALDQLLALKVPEDSVPESDLRDYYEANIEMFTEAAAKRSSHILLPLDDRAKATDLLAELRDSGNLEADFAAAAEESSADSISAADGGDAGWPRVPDQRHADYIAAVEALGVGELSELVRTEQGYYIILVTDEREESIRSFEEVELSIRDMILGGLRSEARAEMLERLRSEATIEIVDPQILAAEPAESAGGI